MKERYSDKIQRLGEYLIEECAGRGTEHGVIQRYRSGMSQRRIGDLYLKETDMGTKTKKDAVRYAIKKLLPEEERLRISEQHQEQNIKKTGRRKKGRRGKKRKLENITRIQRERNNLTRKTGS